MEPIPDWETREFDIDKSKHPDCKFSKDKFTIKKSKIEWHWNFKETSGPGSSLCSIGEVKLVRVNQGALRCGLATIFTTLCLKDLEELSSYVEQLIWAKDKCISLWELYFQADPKSGGFAYFSAAIDSGFTEMLIADPNSKIHGPEKTETWASNFDPDTGMIYDGGSSFETYQGTWFFCRMKQ